MSTGDWDSTLFHRPGYQEGIPATVPVPDSHLTEVLETAARFYPDRVAIDFLGWTITYRELLAATERAAQVLLDAGVRTGDRVALIMPNCPQHVVAVYGALRIGAIVAEHNPLAPASQLRAQIDHHGAKVVVAWEKALATLLAPAPDGAARTPVPSSPAPATSSASPSSSPRMADEFDARPQQGTTASDGVGCAPDRATSQATWGADLTCLSVDISRCLPRAARAALRLPIAKARKTRAALKADSVPASALSWDDAVASSPGLNPTHPYPKGSDVAVLLHTGGTTGTPKAAMLTHTNLRANTNQAIAWVPMLHEGGENFLSLLPFFHAFGLTFNLFCAVDKAATQVMMPKFDVDAVLAANRRRPLSFFVGVPVMFERILRAAQASGADLTALRYGVCGAAPMPPEVGAEWEELTGGFFVEGYGMTETSPIVAGTPMGPTRRLGALGLPFPSTDVRVVDPDVPGGIDPEVEVPDGEAGELLIRGPQVFAGYWNDPEATAAALLPGGWLRTGDMVRREENFLWMADRRRELIDCGGFNVYPSQVEAVLREAPGVADVAVVGMPGVGEAEAGQETVVAAVVLEKDADGAVSSAGMRVTLEALRKHAETSLPHYALPRRLEIIDALPHSLIGKVLRREVREQLARRGR